jgi:hypothetical protein
MINDTIGFTHETIGYTDDTIGFMHVTIGYTIHTIDLINGKEDKRPS